MVAKKDFDIGDLVWAKMKRFPYWPAKIVKPPTDGKSATPKKAQHYVFFFGSKNFAWILDENIVHHSDEMLQSTSNKKKSSSFKLAVEQISEESQSAPKKAKSPVKEEKETPKKSPEVSTSGTTSGTERKISKVQKTKVKTESPKVPKKTIAKRRFLDESSNSISPPPKLPKNSEDYSALISNTPPNLGYNRLAIVRPLEDHGNSICSSGITRRDYFELQPSPFDLLKTSEAVQAKNISPTDKKIGFIGLGMLGQRLVKNLIASKHKVMVWNRTPQKCLDFVKVGAQVAQTPGDVVEKCDIIFCCVSGPEASKNLVFGNCGILSGFDKCTIPGSKGYVEMTTIDPVTSQEIAEAISHKGGRYLEAPISGSRQMAEEGALLILVAGDRDLFTICESCFIALSKNTYYLSCDVGSGSKMSLILSMLMGISHAALAEAMALVERCKLSQANFLEILDLGPLKSTLLSDKGKAMFSHCFTTNNSLKYQQKDLNLALSLSNTCEQPMLLTAAANELFKRAKLLRYSDHDVSAVYMGAKY